MNLIKLVGVKSIFQTILDYGLDADPSFLAHCPKLTPVKSLPFSNKIISELTLNLSFPSYKKDKSKIVIRSGNLRHHDGYTAIQVEKSSYLTFYPCSTFKGSSIDLFYQFMELRSSPNSSWGSTDLVVPTLSWDKTKIVDLGLSKKGKPVRLGQHIRFELQADSASISAPKSKQALMPCIFGFYDTLNGGLPVVVGRIK